MIRTRTLHYLLCSIWNHQLTLRTRHRSRLQRTTLHRYHFAAYCRSTGGRYPAVLPFGQQQMLGWLSPEWQHPASERQWGGRAVCPPIGSAPPECWCTWRGGFKKKVTKLENSKNNKAPSETEDAAREEHWPLKVCDVLIVALAANVNDLGEQLISVGGSFSFVNM